MIQFSFLLPTRERPDMIQRLFESIVKTTSSLDELEIILAIDEDDLISQKITHDQLNIKKIIGHKGLAMGALNRACFEASSGRYVMLMNDDIILRTKNWDKIIASIFGQYEDEIALIHVNDLLFQKNLCCFPMVSRNACLELDNVCPAEYQRYRIDDYIYDIYSILAYLGHKRIIYLPGVIFEHTNHDQLESNEISIHTTIISGKTYNPNKEIIEKDALLFDNSLEERKKDALKLAQLIDKNKYRQQEQQYQKHLDFIQDSYSYRNNNFVRTVSTNNTNFKTSVVTIGVVTANIYNPHTQKCLDSIKKYTSNYDLVILDNNKISDFNHPKEMNRLIQIAKTDYVVLMDDDVFVEEGWLEGLINAMDEETGIVTPMHKDSHGKLSYSGVYLNGDNKGNHAHHIDVPDKPRVVQCICSAVVLIDLKKCRNLLFNTEYKKYFQDIDYPLQVWLAGYKVVCTPHSIVTHIGGGTIPQGKTEQSLTLWERDRQFFVENWVHSGKLQRITNETWPQYPFLKTLIQIPETINYLFNQTHSIEENQFENKVGKLVETVKSFKLFSFSSEIISKIFGLYNISEDKSENQFFKDIINELIDIDSHFPILVNSYHAYNILCYNNNIYAILQSLGAIDLDLKKDLNRRGIIKAKTWEQLKKKIDKQVNLKQFLLNLIANRYSIDFMKVMMKNNYSRKLVLFTARTAAYFYRKLPHFVRSRTDRPLTTLLNLVGGPLQPHVEQGNSEPLSPSFRVENIITTPPTEDFIKTKENYEAYLLLSYKSQQKKKALLIGSIVPKRLKNIPDELQNYNLSFLIPQNEKENWLEYLSVNYKDITWNLLDTLNISNPGSKQIQKLKDQHFDMFIISYGNRISWGNNIIEGFIGHFTNQFMIIHPNGKIKLYDKWDDLMRISYNKDLLATLLKVIPMIEGKRILDVGCSDGMACDLLLCENPESILGIDIMDDVGCNYKDAKITYHKMDASQLQFQDNSFDICFSIAVLEHCKDPFVVLQEIKRVTKKGGYCYVQTAPMYYSPFGHHMLGGYFDDYPWIHLRLSKDEIIEYCKNNKIEAQKTHSPDIKLEDYIYGMLNIDHINEKTLKEYKIDEFMAFPDIEVLHFSRSYEGENLLSDGIIKEIKRKNSHISEEDLISHGIELVFKIK